MSHEGIRIATPEQIARDAEAERPLSRIAVTPEKVRVLITEGKGLEIDWADGHKSSWNFAWLRNACPCATGIDERRQQGRKAGQPKAKPPGGMPLLASVQLARWTLQRYLFVGIPAPQLPVRRVHICGRGNRRSA